MLDVKSWLEATRLKVSEERFIKPPPLPYIVFTDDTDIGGSDTENNIADRTISIELYSLNIDYISEALIKNLLNEKVLKYKNDRIWIDTEQMFESIYDFNFLEKI